jgi:hypothetical protein
MFGQGRPIEVAQTLMMVMAMKTFSPHVEACDSWMKIR